MKAKPVRKQEAKKQEKGKVEEKAVQRKKAPVKTKATPVSEVKVNGSGREASLIRAICDLSPDKRTRDAVVSKANEAMASQGKADSAAETATRLERFLGVCGFLGLLGPGPQGTIGFTEAGAKMFPDQKATASQPYGYRGRGRTILATLKENGAMEDEQLIKVASEAHAEATGKGDNPKQTRFLWGRLRVALLTLGLLRYEGKTAHFLG